MKLLLIFITTLFLASTANAERIQPESFYRDIWCYKNKGHTEVPLEGRTRADCVTETHAIEVEFANKWKDGIGQSLWYSMQTGKKAGIVLIIEKPKDNKYWIRLNSVIEHNSLPIQAWRLDWASDIMKDAISELME